MGPAVAGKTKGVWLSAFAGKTKDVVVVPHADAVPHGGARVAGRTFGYGPARRRCGPPAVTPPWIPVFTGKTKGGLSGLN